jgi:ketosteroid isomerase-like protein
MGDARDVIERYYDAFGRKDPAWKELVAPDVRFAGPLQSAAGSKQFNEITEMFLQFHKATRVVARFEDGNRVCSILDFDLTTPAGAEMSCLVTELATVADGRLSDVTIIYDPRAFAAAFGLS